MTAAQCRIVHPAVGKLLGGDGTAIGNQRKTSGSAKQVESAFVHRRHHRKRIFGQIPMTEGIPVHRQMQPVHGKRGQSLFPKHMHIRRKFRFVEEGPGATAIASARRYENFGFRCVPEFPQDHLGGFLFRLFFIEQIAGNQQYIRFLIPDIHHQIGKKSTLFFFAQRGQFGIVAGKLAVQMQIGGVYKPDHSVFPSFIIFFFHYKAFL